MATKAKTPIHFEKVLAELSMIVEKMEQGDLSLDDSLNHFEKGIQLIDQCQKALKQAEQKIQILTQSREDKNLEDFHVPPLDET